MPTLTLDGHSIILGEDDACRARILLELSENVDLSWRACGEEIHVPAARRADVVLDDGPSGVLSLVPGQ